jgi:hypothetical protein
MLPAVPLRFAFDRPHADGLLGWAFDNFRLLDQPFNQFPSLHIALQIILLGVFVRSTRGVVRAIIGVWFALIAASTLLTYQHHLVDIIGGAALGTLCVYFFREEPLRQSVVRNPKVGRLYGVAAASLIIVAILLRPWGLILLWPAASLCIVTAGYFSLGAGIFRKHAGRVPFVTRVMLWPSLIGQYASLLYYRTRSDAWNAVTDRLWIGRKLTDAEATRAVAGGVTAVLDLAGEFSEARPLLNVEYLQLPVLDLTAPPPATLDRARRVRARSDRPRRHRLYPLQGRLLAHRRHRRRVFDGLRSGTRRESR